MGEPARLLDAARSQVTTAAYVGAWRLTGRLPEPTARRGFERIGEQVYRRDGRSVQRLRENMRRVVPASDVEETTRLGVRSYLRYWCESFRLPTWPVADVVARTRLIGEHHLRTEQDAGRGAVAALPHMGNWDWAGAWACATGMPLTTVAERLEPARLYDEFVAYRSGLGMEILPLTGGGPSYPTLRERVASGRLVCLLADRDLSRTSIEVTLAGHRARMPRGPAQLARDTGTALIPITTAYRGDELELTFHPPVLPAPGEEGIVAMTQGVADAFGAAIRADPVDWHMMQRVFTGDVTARRPTR